jgi:hypothetical protein
MSRLACEQRIEGDVIAYVSVSYEFAIHLGVIFHSVVTAFFVRSPKMSGKFSDLNLGGTVFEFLTEICHFSQFQKADFNVSRLYHDQLDMLLTPYCKTL